MTKKKSVKELKEDAIILEKREISDVFGKLSNVDLNELETKIKLIQNTNNEAKIVTIEKKLEENTKCLKNLMRKETITDKTEEKKEYTCKKYQEKFHNKNDLSKHMIANHLKEIKCQVCEESFDKRYKLELHIKTHELETLWQYVYLQWLWKEVRDQQQQ